MTTHGVYAKVREALDLAENDQKRALEILLDWAASDDGFDKMVWESIRLTTYRGLVSRVGAMHSNYLLNNIGTGVKIKVTEPAKPVVAAPATDSATSVVDGEVDPVSVKSPLPLRRGAGGILPGNKRGLELQGKRMAQYLMNTLQCNGKRLGDATKTDLLVAITERRKTAETNFKSANFMERIASRMPDTKQRVRNVINEADFLSMYQQAEASASEAVRIAAPIVVESTVAKIA